MNKFHLSCMALLCLLCTQLSASTSINNLNILKPLTGSGACAPTIICPPDITVTDGSLDESNNILPSASVAYSYCGTPSVTYTDNITGTTCFSEITRLWTAVSYNSINASNDISQCRQSITVLPTCQLICPPNACVDLSADIDAGSLGTPISSDNSCLLLSTSFIDQESNLCENVNIINRIWNGVFAGYEECNITCIQAITVGDNTAPVISNCPENITIDSNCDIVQWEEPIAQDNCTITTLSSDYRPGFSDFEQGNTLVTYTAADACGNVSECSFLVNVLNNNTHPDCPEDINIITDDINPIRVDWTPPTYSGSCNECPPARQLGGFAFIGSLNGSDYYISTTTYEYMQAQSVSERLGGYIASIGSKEENDFIANNFMSQSVFIGLTDVKKEGDFRWESGESLSYQNWFSNQPNNHNNDQHYVEMLSSGLWNDIDNRKLCFVLEIPCEYVKQVGGPRLGEALYPGTYSIAYTIEDGCGMSMCCSFDITIEYDADSNSRNINSGNMEAISTENISGNKLSKDYTIFPNPVSDILTIELGDYESISQVSVMTLDGKSAAAINSVNPINKVSMENLTPGLHLILIQYKSGDVKYEKIMKI